MAHKSIREYDAKILISKNLNGSVALVEAKQALITHETNIDSLGIDHPWMKNTKLAIKPDHMFGRRGKNNLILLDADLEKAKFFLKEHMNKKTIIGEKEGVLTHFLVETYIPHDKEFYLAIKMGKNRDVIYFSEKGGVNVEENWDKVIQIPVDVLGSLDLAEVEKIIPDSIGLKNLLVTFINSIYTFFKNTGFAYLEINPLAISEGKIGILDTVAKLDDTAEFENTHKWHGIEFPEAFGTELTKEESYIKELDSKSGSSMKLTILNPKGRIWTMIAGGGASVIYADTVCDLGFGKELANYGEYSGNPKDDEVYEYAKSILDLMTRQDVQNKVLIIGGGIANFTDVAKTFKGIIKALEDYSDKIVEQKIKIYVRRGGPNFKEGLEKMKQLGKETNMPISVYGPETHMTEIVSLAVGGN
ncbi:MAG: ATP citrate lyase citrate-binding domain-containing protein [Candidatus Aenigmatarchaeota archaeon]